MSFLPFLRIKSLQRYSIVNYLVCIAVTSNTLSTTLNKKRAAKCKIVHYIKTKRLHQRRVDKKYIAACLWSNNLYFNIDPLFWHCIFPLLKKSNSCQLWFHSWISFSIVPHFLNLQCLFNVWPNIRLVLVRNTIDKKICTKHQVNFSTNKSHK